VLLWVRQHLLDAPGALVFGAGLHQARRTASRPRLRGGTSPKVGRTRFDASTNGIDWISLAPVTRISGGWRVSGLALPTNAPIRARGFLTGGYYNI
jgi:hypothetical protein